MFLFCLLIAINCLSFSSSVGIVQTIPNKYFHPDREYPLSVDLIHTVRGNTVPNESSTHVLLKHDNESHVAKIKNKLFV